MKRKLAQVPVNLPTYSTASLENSAPQRASVAVWLLDSAASMQAGMAGMPAALAVPVVATGSTQPTQQQQLSLLPDRGRLLGR